MSMIDTLIELDLPVAYLVGYEPVGTISTPNHLVDGELRHVSNQVGYGNGDRTVIKVSRRGWTWGEPREALCWHMFRIAVTDAMAAGIDNPTDVHLAELEAESHAFTPAVLTVDGTAYDGWQVVEHGVVARAVAVDGWTVMAVVPDGAEVPEVTFAQP